MCIFSKSIQRIQNYFIWNSWYSNKDSYNVIFIAFETCFEIKMHILWKGDVRLFIKAIRFKIWSDFYFHHLALGWMKYVNTSGHALVMDVKVIMDGSIARPL